MDNIKDITDKLNIDSTIYTTRVSDKFKSRLPYKPEDDSLLFSFIPGTIVELLVKPGDQVKKGDEIMILEAMKMKNRLLSHKDGVIEEIMVKAGERVPKGTLLMKYK